jgi:metacaspase-1
MGLLSAVTSYARGDMGGVFKSAMGLVKTATGNNNKAQELSRRTKTSPADCVCTWASFAYPRDSFVFSDLIQWM